jgi:hypothetical protein
LRPWRKGQFRAGGKEMFEVDKGRFPVRQCAVLYGNNYTQSLREGQVVVENTFLYEVKIATAIVLKIPYESVYDDQH